MASVRHALPVLSVAAMRAVDAATIEEDLPLLALMENAGRAAFDAYRERWGLAPLHLLPGPGHNGADALVMGRIAAAHGVPVRCWGYKCDLGEVGEMQWRLAEREGAVWEERGLDAIGDREAVVVDGLLGTGTRGEPREKMASLVRAVNDAPYLGRLALDAPTGADMDTGAAPGVAFRADLTVAFAFLKPGLLLQPGAELAGEVRVAYIGISRHRAVDPAGWAVTPAAVAALLPPFPADGHKGTAGRVGVWAGSARFPGAARLALEGALRSGAGVVHWTGRGEAPPEVIQEGAPPSGCRQGLDAWAIGPGLGSDDDALESIRGETSALASPAVLDADALAAWAGRAGELAGHPAARLLTPHHAEAAALLGVGVPEVEADRPGACSRLAESSGQTVLLKGAPTLVAGPGRPVHYVGAGGPALAKGGTGDVLAGLAGGLLARGLDPLSAGVAAAWVHGRAGALWEAGGRPRETATASEVAPLIEAAWRDLEA